ncbi:hypothetical protein HPB51_005211 [Rhipicephalus microplus]|uniref:TRAF1-6 MATH domain-containing protein n=1 Tax=Rhipicephalus microplus TaxID=6941 RepID=A0A9J6E758_RHIMP|nr:uncharacterized protein LOC119163220 isoform X1 [Rhipicephalus microplus]KAH8029909.1 hypothetical protein HPB51_005211 [Rhipicephalus microplus]
MGGRSSKQGLERFRADTDDSVVPREADPATGVVDEPQPGTMDTLPKESLCHLAVGSAVTCTYNGKEARLLKPFDQPSTLDGYTFNLACKFESKKGKIESVRFLFTLCAGNEDDLASWPFAKQVSLRIVDAAQQGKDVGVTFKMRPEEDAECFRRPVAHAPQKGILSEKVSWKQVNKRKLVRDDVLTVAVQFQ